MKKAAIPLIAFFILRSLPVFLCILGLWAAGRYVKRRRHVLSECADCTHAENCHIGKISKKAKRCKPFMNSRVAIFFKIAFVLGCLLARAMPLWMVLPPFLVALWCRRQLCQFKKGMCQEMRGNANVLARLKEMLQAFVQTCDSLDRALWNQICGRARTATVAAAAVMDRANLDGVNDRMDGVNDRMDGIRIPVALPPAGPAFQQQLALLQEMGFDNTAVLQPLLLKHSGNLQAVITEYIMQFNKEKRA